MSSYERGTVFGWHGILNIEQCDEKLDRLLMIDPSCHVNIFKKKKDGTGKPLLNSTCAL